MVSAMPKQVIVFAGAPSTSSKVAVGVGLMRIEMLATAGTKGWGVTVTDANGCKSVANISILINPTPTATLLDVDGAPAKTITCLGIADTMKASVTSGTLPYTYSWNHLTPTSLVGDSAINTNTGTAGTKGWGVTVTDANGCKSVANISILINPTPTATLLDVDGAPAKLTTCLGIADTMKASVASGTLPYTYSWNHLTPTSLVGDSAINTNSGTAGTKGWGVTVTDANGCKSVANISILINPTPTATLLDVDGAPAKTITCLGIADTMKASVASGTLPYTYSWNHLTPTSLVGDSAINTNTGTAGTKGWGVTVTDANGCKSVANISILINPTPTASLFDVDGAAAKTTTCFGIADTMKAVVVSGTLPYTYSWNHLVPTSAMGDSAINTVSTGSAGLKTWGVTVTDANGCKSVATVSITITALPVLSITARNPIVPGTKDTLTVTGGTTYLWNTTGTNDTIIVHPSVSTTYTVTGTTNGCSSVATFTLNMSTSTGINNTVASVEGEVYPNPASETLFVKITSTGVSTQASLSILDIEGKELIATREEISSGNAVSVNIASLPAGLYFVRVTMNGSSQVVKFIKH